MPRTSALTDFCVEQLRLNPDLTLPDLRARAVLEGIIVHPVAFHRARASLGLEPVRMRRGRRPTAVPAAEVIQLASHASAAAGTDLDDVLSALTALHEDRDRLRANTDAQGNIGRLLAQDRLRFARTVPSGGAGRW